MNPKNKDFVVSLSFANYLKDKSGMPKVMLEHSKMYADSGISYIGLFSVKKNLFHDRIMLFCKFGLIVDGTFRGIYQMSQLLTMFASWCGNGHRLLDLHIHHLLYVDLNRAEELLNGFPDVPIKVFLHDYYNACTNHNLLQQKTTFCGGKGLSPEYCGDCAHYKDSVRLQRRIHGMYQRHLERIIFISPSEITRSIFLNFHPEYTEKVLVLPHEVFDKRTEEKLAMIEKDEKIRVAYLGMASYHKGWHAWKELVEKADHNSYDFIVFNSTHDTYPGMRHVNVSFASERINAMVDALKGEKVHVAVFWSMCPETYSYTCFEAFCANAVLITREGSGNIADTVKRYECGKVLKDEAELFALFGEPEKLKADLNRYRQTAPGGPEKMRKNTQIVELSRRYEPKADRESTKKVAKPVNYPLLWLLNLLYRHGNI